jgi:hypothetical protein
MNNKEEYFYATVFNNNNPGSVRVNRGDLRNKSSVSSVNVKVKMKLSLRFLTKHHAMKMYWGSGGRATLIL